MPPRIRSRSRADYQPHAPRIRIPLITGRGVFEACDALAREGRKVSVRNVRDRLRGGSFRDLTPHLQRWRAQHLVGDSARAAAGLQGRVPQAHAAATNDLTELNATLQQATYQTRALEERLVQQIAIDFADLRQRFAVENAALKDELARARAERETFIIEIAHARATLAAVQAKLKAARTRARRKALASASKRGRKPGPQPSARGTRRKRAASGASKAPRRRPRTTRSRDTAPRTAAKRRRERKTMRSRK